jgi:hypothetical protein
MWQDRPCLCVVACYKKTKALRFSVVKQFQHKTKCNIKMRADKCDEITTVVMGYGQEDQGIRGKRLSLLHGIQTSSEAHSATYPAITG